MGFTGADLRKVRKEMLGMTQRDLAAELDVPVNTLARWERSALEMQHPRMLRLALQGIAAQASADP